MVNGLTRPLTSYKDTMTINMLEGDLRTYSQVTEIAVNAIATAATLEIDHVTARYIGYNLVSLYGTQ